MTKIDGLKHSLLSAVACGDSFKLSRDECKFLAEYIEEAEIEHSAWLPVREPPSAPCDVRYDKHGVAIHYRPIKFLEEECMFQSTPPVREATRVSKKS